ncbi:hypothetical protein H6F87_28195 [Cyanobacteria bacterium FACHB-502]|nr:hypothetical protein [Cyanobacteria bacterium FACHB-502]MBD2027399.1 hypothetical protein [Leptolyngbya sp. FACHB-711]
MCSGGAGNDLVDDGEGGGDITGRTKNDRLIDGLGDDTINGNARNDRIESVCLAVTKNNAQSAGGYQ